MTFPSEKRTYADPLTGVPVTQLTHYRGHSHHFYFTNPGWYAGGSRFLFSSDRSNRTNLFGVDLASGEIEQFTDLPPPPPGARFDFVTACKNGRRDEVYFWHDHTLRVVDLSTKTIRDLLDVDPAWKPSMTASSCDGAHLYFGLEQIVISEDYSNSRQNNLGIRARWLAKPLSRIVRLPIAPDGSVGSLETIFEERALLGHINTSPTQAHLITYCHEGPWEEVDCRIWVMDTRSGHRWKIEAPQRRFHIGHEYWYADGLRIGYHGITGRSETVIGGASVVEGTPGHWHAPQQTVTGHIYSLDDNLVVGDAYHDGVMKIWMRIDGEIRGPRVLCRHDCSFKIQQLHVHPRISSDGRYVVFTSDRGGYGNIYTAPLPQDAAAFNALPVWTGDV
ncbi:oligogalacturonide lyase [Opitutaceae bacterium TAV4]|nr:oligogalacturonide lyase [Opitutaceae bacterium TAV4]RRJ99113.1 oligogalacturonide lyase [Opitutaceae bacterium TAV3]